MPDAMRWAFFFFGTRLFQAGVFVLSSGSIGSKEKIQGFFDFAALRSE
jgi:hypothetical protein